MSDDGRLLAYSTDTTGFREYTLYVKDLRTGELLPEHVAEKVGAVAWAADGRTLFYTVEDESPSGPYRAVPPRARRAEPTRSSTRRRTSSSASGVGRTRSKALPVPRRRQPHHDRGALPARRRARGRVDGWSRRARTSTSTTSTTTATGSTSAPTTRGRNFRLVHAPVADPGRERWKEVVPHRPDVMLEGVELFQRHSVLLEREDGLPHAARHRPRARGESHRIEFPEPAYSAFPGQQPRVRHRAVPLHATSRWSRRSRSSTTTWRRAHATLLKEQPGAGRLRPHAATCPSGSAATAPDGAKVPISLVYRKGCRATARRRCYLYGYGSYGYPAAGQLLVEPAQPARPRRVVALAHIRGGGELGKAWHDDGRMLKKRNTFTDFIAVRRAPDRARGTPRPDRLVDRGRQRRRPADGRGRQPAARPVPGRASRRCRSWT